MSKISDLTHLGMFLSLLPDSQLRDLLFQYQCVPTRIRGLSTKPRNVIDFEFNFRSRNESQTYKAVWNIREGIITYHYSRSGGRSRSGKHRVMDSLAWMIEVRTLLGDERYSLNTASLEPIGRRVRGAWETYQESYQAYTNPEPSE
jgi:hypothetical protein